MRFYNTIAPQSRDVSQSRLAFDPGVIKNDFTNSTLASSVVSAYFPTSYSMSCNGYEIMTWFPSYNYGTDTHMDSLILKNSKTSQTYKTGVNYYPVLNDNNVPFFTTNNLNYVSKLSSSTSITDDVNASNLTIWCCYTRCPYFHCGLNAGTRRQCQTVSNGSDIDLETLNYASSENDRNRITFSNIGTQTTDDTYVNCIITTFPCTYTGKSPINPYVTDLDECRDPALNWKCYSFGVISRDITSDERTWLKTEIQKYITVSNFYDSTF